ncbi:hypothetical protein X927_06080 [Petrotoga mexicana DSM 14811]|jgi:hypothetical protein|uniref:Uncharacterized protein n=1 Tax=Petrotoga mexicana DSM 14811 TaxID=1122954 RepID=A0A2K1P935_9BACT|nr:hypothetical protein [Petrotoga mexicana]PNR99237.1 hypothetical protein X927_06080 [Petrotoga mexicana DSM 14811]
MKKFIAVLFITVLLLSGIFVFGGEGNSTGSTDGVVPRTVVSVVEGVE